MNPELEQKIEDYVIGNLSEVDRADLEAKMASDPDLQAEVSLEQATQAAVRQEGRAALKARLQSLSQAEGSAPVTLEAPVRRLLPRWPMAAAAAILLFAVAAVLLWPGNRNYADPAGSYASHYQPFDAGVTKGGLTDDYAQMAAQYQAGEYAAVIPFFETLSDTSLNYAASRMLLGCSYLETDQIEKANGTFTQLKAQNDIRFNGPAQFYLGLALLKAGKSEEAKVEFSALSKLNLPKWSDKAGEVLSSL